ncbi:hypothetical protein LTR95_000633 [Oleoguttula sp. CCFEE 5521]
MAGLGISLDGKKDPKPKRSTSPTLVALANRASRQVHELGVVHGIKISTCDVVAKQVAGHIHNAHLAKMHREKLREAYERQMKEVKDYFVQLEVERLCKAGEDWVVVEKGEGEDSLESGLRLLRLSEFCVEDVSRASGLSTGMGTNV